MLYRSYRVPGLYFDLIRKTAFMENIETLVMQVNLISMHKRQGNICFRFLARKSADGSRVLGKFKEHKCTLVQGNRLLYFKYGISIRNKQNTLNEIQKCWCLYITSTAPLSFKICAIYTRAEGVL